MSSFVIYDEERPGAFWLSMGPHFASDKVRRALTFLSDKPGRVWVIAHGVAPDSPARAFACGDPGEDAVLREVWAENGEAVAGTEAAKTLLRYLISTGALRVRATVKGPAVKLLTDAGFLNAGTKGTYTLLEARP